MNAPISHPWQKRPAWNPAGRVVVRRDGLKIGAIEYAGGAEPAPETLATEGVTTRILSAWWELGLIDTLPPAPKGKPKSADAGKTG